MFDLMSRRRPMIWLLDRCAWELPRLREVYGEGLRGRYFSELARYVRTRRAKSGGGEKPAAIGRAIVEMVAFMAMHRLQDAGPLPIDAATARRACIAVARGGLGGTAACSARPRPQRAFA